MKIDNFDADFNFKVFQTLQSIKQFMKLKICFISQSVLHETIRNRRVMIRWSDRDWESATMPPIACGFLRAAEAAKLTDKPNGAWPSISDTFARRPKRVLFDRRCVCLNFDTAAAVCAAHTEHTNCIDARIAHITQIGNRRLTFTIGIHKRKSASDSFDARKGELSTVTQLKTKIDTF